MFIADLKEKEKFLPINKKIKKQNKISIICSIVHSINFDLLPVIFPLILLIIFLDI